MSLYQMLEIDRLVELRIDPSIHYTQIVGGKPAPTENRAQISPPELR